MLAPWCPAGERPASFEQFSAAIDPQWIADVLATEGKASVRRRKLPADRARLGPRGRHGVRGWGLRVADTPKNIAAFGRRPSRHGEGAGYPQLRLVALLALRHHLLAAATFGPYRISELALATQLWAAVPNHALVILDRGFATYALFHALTDPGRTCHWLVRARGGRTALACQVVQRLGTGDALVELRPSHATRAAHPGLPSRCASRPSACTTAASVPTSSSPPFPARPQGVSGGRARSALPRTLGSRTHLR